MTTPDKLNPEESIDNPTPLDDTQPNPVLRMEPEPGAPSQTGYPMGYIEDEMPAPPKLLLFGVLGLLMLGVIGFLSGIVIFREVLNQGQQQRVINNLPFMEAFLETQPTPEGGMVQRADEADPNAANDLLNLSLGIPEATAEADATAELTQEVTAEAVVVTEPPAATPAPTQTPQPTSTPDSSANAAPVDPAPAVGGGTDGSVELVEDTVSTLSWDLSAYNTGFTYYRQTWNNCGPANISMALSYYGWTRDMDYAADRLRPNADDKNVSPWEMVRFVEQESDIQALWRVGGDLDLLRTLITNQFPVIIERGQRFEGTDWLGHYQTIVGYDDNLRQFYVYDSFLGNNDGNGRAFSYEEVDTHWREFNRTFIVVYEPSREQSLMNLLADHASVEGAAEQGFLAAQEEARLNPQDPHAWFNMGSSLVLMQQYDSAATAFDRSFSLGLPWRILWYQFGPYEAFYEVGRYNDVLDLVNANLQNGGDKVEETYYWQGRVLEALGRTAEARSAYNRALSRNRLFDAAREALNSLS